MFEFDARASIHRYFPSHSPGVDHALKLDADRPDNTPDKVICIKLALLVAKAPLVSLTYIIALPAE